jgi:hypothetical protein
MNTRPRALVGIAKFELKLMAELASNIARTAEYRGAGTLRLRMSEGSWCTGLHMTLLIHRDSVWSLFSTLAENPFPIKLLE